MGQNPRPSRNGSLIARATITIALTLDDAPSVAQAPGVPFAAERMDQVRETLAACGVRDCVAFVIGNRLAPGAAELRRWLAAGYSLGNHTHTHQHATQLSAAEFRDDVRRCDEILTGAGAFQDGRPKWFRFPFLDCGKDASHREAMRAALHSLGYVIVPGAVDLYDHCFDAAMVTGRAAEAGARWVDVAIRSIRLGNRVLTARAGHALPLIAYMHFGPTVVANLRLLLERMQQLGFGQETFTEALQATRASLQAPALEASGPLARSLPPWTTLDALRRRGIHWSERLNLFAQRELGPLWPHLR